MQNIQDFQDDEILFLHTAKQRLKKELSTNKVEKPKDIIRKLVHNKSLNNQFNLLCNYINHFVCTYQLFNSVIRLISYVCNYYYI